MQLFLLPYGVWVEHTALLVLQLLPNCFVKVAFEKVVLVSVPFLMYQLISLCSILAYSPYSHLAVIGNEQNLFICPVPCLFSVFSQVSSVNFVGIPSGC